MRWALLGISVLALILSIFFAWQKSEIDSGWDPDRLVVDVARVQTPSDEILYGEGGVPHWMDRLVRSEGLTQLLADEMFISWNLVPPEFRYNLVLALSFDHLNDFDRLCLQAFLIQRGVAHEWIDGEPIHLRIHSKDPDYAQKLLSELATYDLMGQLLVLQETKPY